MLLLGVRNLGLGGWMPGECMALENEVSAWQQEGAYDQHDNALRWGHGGRASRACVWLQHCTMLGAHPVRRCFE